MRSYRLAFVVVHELTSPKKCPADGFGYILTPIFALGGKELIVLGLLDTLAVGRCNSACCHLCCRWCCICPVDVVVNFVVLLSFSVFVAYFVLRNKHASLFVSCFH
jgi:hypothetical protein